MGVAAQLVPKGLYAINPTNKLSHWMDILGQLLSQNDVFQNFEALKLSQKNDVWTLNVWKNPYIIHNKRLHSFAFPLCTL